METPLSPRVCSITNHDRTEYSPIVAKENFSLIGGPGTGNGFLDNQGKENECTGSVDEDFEEDEQQVRSRKAQTINNVHGKRTGNNSNKKTPEGVYAGCFVLRKNYGYVGWQWKVV